MDYQLNSIEQALVYDLACSRNEKKEQAGVQSRRYDPNKTDLQLHFIGLSAEYAFSMLTGLLPNFGNTLRGDSGHDFVTKDGLTIELKFRGSRHRDFALVDNSLEGMRADIGVLMWPSSTNDDAYEFVGWTTRVHAAQVGTVKKLLKNRFLVSWEDMLNPKDFMNLL